MVLGGATLGAQVMGVPLASFVAPGWDWRVAFGALAVLGIVAAVLVRAVVTRAVVPGSADERAATPVAQLRPVLVVAGLVGLVLVGHFTAFTFVTRLVADAGRGAARWRQRGAAGVRGVVGRGLALVGRVCRTGRPRRCSSRRRSSSRCRCSPWSSSAVVRSSASWCSWRGG